MPPHIAFARWSSPFLSLQTLIALSFVKIILKKIYLFLYVIHPHETLVHMLFSSVQITYTPNFDKNKNKLYFWAGFKGFLDPKSLISHTQCNVTISNSLWWYISTYGGVYEGRKTCCKNMFSIFKPLYSLNLWVVSLDLKILFSNISSSII